MSMEYLKVRNWDKWQTYRSDRGKPPWIKVHRCLQQDWEWVDLPDKQRGQLVAIWLLASSRDGVIPASPEKVQKLCNMSDLPDLNELITLGFLDGEVTMASDGCQDDATDKIREVKLSTEEDKKKKCPRIKFSDADLSFAEYMYGQVLTVAPKTKKPNMDKWADTIRLLREQDKNEPAEIQQVFTWANNDNFWKTNILSPTALRDKFPKLHSQMNNRGNSNGQTSGSRKLTAVERIQEAGRQQLEAEQRTSIIDITPHGEALGEDG